MRYLLLFIFFLPSLLVAQPSFDSIPPIECGVQGLQGQIDCFPFAPNQGQLQVM
tara:strand:- start:485 stop:646 length:162 start_codon:yes stop_codon:yes gene_type:complete